MTAWPRRQRRLLGRYFVLAAMVLRCVAVGADELELLDGIRHVGLLTHIAADGSVRGDRLPTELKLDDLRRVLHVATGEAGVPTAVVDLSGGGRLLVQSVELRDERVVVGMTDRQSWSLPLEIVRGIRCDIGGPTAAYSRALARPAADVDRFFVRAEDAGAIEGFDALVEQLAPAAVTFELGGKQRELPRTRLYGIVLARPANEVEAAPRGWVELKQESRVPFEKLDLVDEVLTVSGPAGLKIEVPWSLVVAIDARSPRLAFVSDLTPSKVGESSIVAPARSWRRDKSVGGRRLTIGKTSYDKGVGVQANSSLSFTLDRQYELFLATVGIDAETSGEGDCVMAVLGDGGRPLWRERVRGGEPARQLRLEVRDTQTLTLVVESGEDLDLSDHANWADARLIRPRP